MRTFTRLLTIRLALLALFVALLGMPAQPAQAAWGKPGTPAIAEIVPTAAALSWKMVSGAPGYRVKYSTARSWTKPRYVLTADPRSELGKLKPGTTYYVKVRVARPDGTNLGPYSATTAFTTPATSKYAELSPAGLTGSSAAAGSLSLRWSARGSTKRYRLEYATTASGSDARYVRVSGTSHTVTGLRADTRYWVRVRVVKADGGNLSRYSAAVAVATAPSGSTKAPTGVAVTSRSNSALQLSWKAVAGAGAYRVKYASSSSWKGAKYRVVTGPGVELTKLAAGRTYYAKVRVVTAADQPRSGYSRRVKAATRPASSFPHLRPGTPTASAVAATSVTVSWPSRGSGLSYRVRYDSDDGYASPSYALANGTKTTLTGLLPDTRYSVSVRVVGAKDTPTLSEYSASLTVRTPTRSAPLRVASYNVKAHNGFKGLPGETVWSQRRTAVADLILKQAPDVIGLQEAQQSRLLDANGKLTKVAQMEDLVGLLGSPYKLVNPYRYDCVKSTSKTNCVAQNRETSRGVRIVYNSAELTLKRHGAKRLSYVDADDMERYVAWAVFRHIDSGKDFVFADVHFENKIDSDGGTRYYEIRKTQTRESLAEVNAHNPGKLPVIFAGDLNSTKTRVPDNAPYDLMRAAGYVDPLGNTYRSTSIASWATAEKRIKANYNSFNRWQLSPPKSSNPNGTYYDYIFTSGPLRVSEWETAMTLNADGTYRGVIPSDHHLLRATVWLP